jgi:hypothetical protein
MASFISTNETLERRQNGVVSRTGGKIINRVLEESAGVDAGRFVCPSGTAGIACEDIDSAADCAKALGPLVFRPMAYDADLTDGAPHYAENEVACILEEGYMFVDCEGTVVAESPVYVRHTSDGSSNTELGKVRGDSNGGVTLTTTATADGQYRVTLTNGTVTETFGFTASSSTAAQIITGLVAAIDASANFAATGTTTATITAQTGTEVAIVSLDAPTNAALALYVKADTQLAAKAPNAYFAESRTGAGLVEIRVGAPNR